MKTRQILSLTLFAGLACSVPAAPIEHHMLKSDTPLTLAIGTKTVTTLQFPRPLQGIFGYGLTAGDTLGTYHYAHPDGSRVLALRNLMPDKETYLTILLGAEDLYVLHLTPSSDPPIMVRLSEPDSLAARRVEVDALTKRHLDQNTTRLFNLLKLGKNERTFRISVPHLYQNVESRNVDYRRDDDKVVTVVSRLHRFPEEDAVFLEGQIENKTDAPLYFDPGSLQVKVGSRTYPSALVDSASRLPAGGKIPVHVIVQGGPEGERAHLSIKNEFQMIMPACASSPNDLSQADQLGTILEAASDIHIDGPDVSLFPDPKGGSK